MSDHRPGPGEQGNTAHENEIDSLRRKMREAKEQHERELQKLIEGAVDAARAHRDEIDHVRTQLRDIGNTPIEMLLWCPACGDRHVDVGEFATKVHHTHACQHCGMVWRPCVSPTVGVQFLPGFKNLEGV